MLQKSRQLNTLSRDSEENNVQDSGPTSFVMWAGRKVLNKVADSIVVRLVKEYGKEMFEVLQQVW